VCPRNRLSPSPRRPKRATGSSVSSPPCQNPARNSESTCARRL
jgi:hypothetical protein